MHSFFCKTLSGLAHLNFTMDEYIMSENSGAVEVCLQLQSSPTALERSLIIQLTTEDRTAATAGESTLNPDTLIALKCPKFLVLKSLTSKKNFFAT